MWSDALIWLAYLAIPALLVYFVRRRADLPFNWIFLLFGAFIVLCGFTHLIEVFMFDDPVYRLSGVLKAATAGVSWLAVVALVPLLPKALSLPGVERLNRELKREVRERKAAEEALQRTAGELERSNADLESFAFVASHDLREPLRKVQAFGGLLERRAAGELGEEGREFLARMMDASRRMERLIDDLLALSRVGQPETLSRFPVEAAVREALSNLEVVLREARAEVDVGGLPEVEAERSQLVQLFQNLVSNAVKYRREDAPCRIRIRGEADQDHVRIQVSDEGIGFPPEEAERIFGFFTRLHPRSRYEGSGLGLAVSRRIAERHGGAIRAEGRPGEGATFTVDLPRRQRREPGPAEGGAGGAG